MSSVPAWDEHLGIFPWRVRAPSEPWGRIPVQVGRAQPVLVSGPRSRRARGSAEVHRTRARVRHACDCGKAPPPAAAGWARRHRQRHKGRDIAAAVSVSFRPRVASTLPLAAGVPLLLLIHAGRSSALLIEVNHDLLSLGERADACCLLRSLGLCGYLK